ncbi:hypothetical protein Cni_G23984 [Canna indica]|uniref:Uncharacterized protein n=1 Tax=Canna indica TaxID=4628 RepID=A0AAQ3KY76_9LILI|nr:hypothetical protein Cni_G23984 [Canna indica]
MEKEMQQLIPKSLHGSRTSAGAYRHRYTSLSDVLLRHRYHPAFRSALGGVGRSRRASTLLTPQHHYGMIGSRDLYSPANICIRNKLVKHAASAYVQSASGAAVVVANRNQNCITRMWWRLREPRPSWRACMRDPFEQCVGLVARSVSRVLACVVSHLSRVCTWGRTSIA